MINRRKRVAATLVAVATGAVVLTNAPAQADFSPQPQDVVSTGSDIIQNSFNFLADGYHQLPGYNTAGNRYRFVNFDSSGDAQGRSAFTDPRLLPTITGNGTVGEDGTKYIKQSDVKLLNPTISLGAGQDLVVRPSGGSGGGTNAIIADDEGNIDIGRAPNPLTTDNENNAQTNLKTKLYRIQIATDRQFIATAATGSNAPATISAGDILKIYGGQITTWGQVTGYSGSAGDQKIIPLILPTDAGMWSTFVANVRRQNGLGADPNLRSNPNSVQVQQNDPTAITSLTPAQQANAIVPFPRGRYNVLNKGYYTDPSTTNAYNTEPERTPTNANGIKLLDGTSTTDVNTPTAPYGGNFGYNAIVRQSDVDSTTPWQPGSTLNWVQALFYNPKSGGPLPFVRTPAGKALLEAAGVTPDYHVYGTDLAEIDNP